MVRLNAAVRALAVVAALGCVQASPVMAQQASPPIAIVQEVDAIENRVMAVVVSGASDAATQIFANTPLMAGRVTEISALNTQISGAANLYGRAVAWEKIGDHRIGSFVINRRYAVQHEQMVTIWYLTYIYVDGAWRVASLFFNDQVMRLEDDW